MLASRIRDETLRAAAHDFLEAHEEVVEDPLDGVRRGEGEETRAGEPRKPCPQRPTFVLRASGDLLTLVDPANPAPR